MGHTVPPRTATTGVNTEEASQKRGTLWLTCAENYFGAELVGLRPAPFLGTTFI
ncbi:MAG: hypothetical protein JWM36_3879, partial [Hyphomicrobiales bacterium]|nr:hypothetical protein [Hyphomicrobiales bacterium]